MDATAPAGADVYAATGLPELGFRNYWYPVLAAWRLRRRPKAVKLLGEDVVLFRDGGRVHALKDQCAHRGARLSDGKCLYPGTGTLTCPYHGWTYSGETGQCVAKLMEGPDAALPSEARRAISTGSSHASALSQCLSCAAATSTGMYVFCCAKLSSISVPLHILEMPKQGLK